MALSVDVVSGVFENPDAKLAAYLCLLGYDEPACQRRGKGVVFVFARIAQDDVLRFYNSDPAYIAPLALFRQYDRLIAKAKLTILNMSQVVFES